MSDCIFCKIIDGEIPSTKVFENEHVLAFLDISQVTKGHTLVIPKVHKENLYELTPEIAKESILCCAGNCPSYETRILTCWFKPFK